jgi:diguanylate cyclase (GGDEF)-like protein
VVWHHLDLMKTRGANPNRATALLTAGLALLGAGLAAIPSGPPLLPAPWGLSRVQIAFGLAVLFCLAEFCLLHVEVRREAYSMTLADLPLALGVLLCGPWQLIAARVLGSAVAFTIQRSPPSKATYNVAAYAAEAALDVVLVQLLVSESGELTARTAVACYVIVVLVDQLMMNLILQVIRWHQGGITQRVSAAVRVPAMLVSLLSTTAALATLILVREGALGVIVLAVFTVTAVAAYRGFQILHRRHEALEQVHDFVGLNSGSESAEDLAGRMLGQVRSLMRADTAELLLVEPDGPVQLSVGEDDVLRVVPDAWARSDEFVSLVRTSGSPALLPAGTRRASDRSWLRARGVRDAVVVPLPRGSGDGALMVLDRLGNTGSFTREDQAMLQTLAGHLSVAVRSSTLMDRLRYEATHDVLTGLANRSLLEQTLRSALAGDDRDAGAVLLLDLDRFKEVNDTLGHHVGDALLRSLARTIQATLPADATVARLGGDEFAAFLPRPGDAGQVTALAEALERALASPVQLPEAMLSTRASIGVALASAGGNESDLLRHADTAMYVAKEAGDAVVLYTSELDRGRAERLALLADLHLALDRNELRLAYQPKLDLVTDEVNSVEALVRWHHPRLGLLGPTVFVPLAEANGLIGPLTEHVLHEALGQCAEWRTQGVDVAVAVNLSARVVNNSALPALISAALLDAGVPASRLILEITESSVMDDYERAVPILERISAIGVMLSLDDFGTGYSSLAYLQQLPVSEVKIDRSFIAGLVTDEGRSQVLVRAIISLATSLGHRVVAEGPEDVETLDLLRSMGCHLVQGFYVSRPESPEVVAAFVRQHPRPGSRILRLAT